MNIRFLIPGKCREKYIKDGYDEYLKRLSRFAKVSLEYLPEEIISNNSESEISKALKKEAANALKRIKDDEVLFIVDIHGKSYDSKEFASLIDDQSKKNGNLVFLLGSSYGLDDSIRKRANVSFSLSKLTFTHYMALFLTMEQVYRSMKINRGENYDK